MGLGGGRKGWETLQRWVGPPGDNTGASHQPPRCREAKQLEEREPARSQIRKTPYCSANSVSQTAKTVKQSMPEELLCSQGRCLLTHQNITSVVASKKLEQEKKKIEKGEEKEKPHMRIILRFPVLGWGCSVAQPAPRQELRWHHPRMRSTRGCCSTQHHLTPCLREPLPDLHLIGTVGVPGPS